MSTIAVCVKWVDLHPEIDQVSGAVTTDARRHGFSDSDEAALEVALRLADQRGGEVLLLSVAPSAAIAAIEQLAASGATSVHHVVAGDVADSATVGSALAAAIRGRGGVDLVVTGDYSLDRGSGSVPSFVAHELGWQQALGLIGVADDGRAVVRRLDGARREHLRIEGPAVLSVEGSVARLRRASMRSMLAAKALPRTVGHLDSAGGIEVGPTRPIRPRARAFPAPQGDRALSRIVELTGALVERTPPRRVEAEPAAAAAEILAQLRAWSYLG